MSFIKKCPKCNSINVIEDKKRGEYYLKGNIKRLQDYIYNKVQTGEDVFELLFKFKISTDD